MSDLKRYIAKRKQSDASFAKDYDAGYSDFKIGATLRAMRERAGLTQEQLARKVGTKKSAISRIENHAEDIRLSTLGHIAKALGRKLEIKVA
jgi:HTH-type transcriptional regulator / antitoxin HipB